MNKDYLQLGGKSYRVEANWNSHVEYCALQGIEDLSALDNLAKLSAAELRDFIYCCIKEGERLDGKELSLTAMDIGAAMRPSDILSFMKIYQKQCFTGINDKTIEPNAVKKKRRFTFHNSKE